MQNVLNIVQFKSRIKFAGIFRIDGGWDLGGSDSGDDGLGWFQSVLPIIKFIRMPIGLNVTNKMMM